MADLRVIAAGAQTGGHLYPALAVLRTLAARGATVTLVASGEPAELLVLKDAGVPVEVLRVGKLKGMGWKARAKGVASLPSGLARAFALVGRLQPDVVLGCGGFTTGPLLLAAALRGVPTAILEQNSVPGFTNRVLGRFAKRIFVAFDETAQRFGGRRTVRTGTPVRPEILAVPGKTFEGPARRVLVFGGSQGSRFLNEHVPPVLAALARRGMALEVLHQAGRGNEASVRKTWEGLGAVADVREYLHDMAGAYAWADFVVSRAGAGTVSEVAAVGLPALFVPFALAADDHQTANARPLAEAGGALSVSEAAWDEEAVVVQLGETLSDPARLSAMSQAMRGWARRDALDAIAAEVEALGRSAKQGDGH